MEEVYDFYLNTFDRISFDDAWWRWSGNNIKLYINTGMEDNAHWNPNKKAIFIGEGIEKNGIFQDMSLVASIDTVCHEFTHGVVANETSLEWRYYGTAGAINEGYADLFSCFCDGNWMYDEYATLGECLRNIENPFLSFQPKSVGDMHYVDYKTETEDNAGVHTNSTLISHTAYRMFDKGMDMDTLQKLWYKSLCLGYSKHSDFYDVRLKIIKAAKKLKLSDAEIEIINEAFDDANILKSNCDETKESYFDMVDEMSVASEMYDDTLYITGKIVKADEDNNISNNIKLEDVIIVYDDVVGVSTDKNGFYNMEISENDFWVLSMKKDGYISENYYITTINSMHRKVHCSTVELISVEDSGLGQASGKIVNATSNKGIEGLTLKVRRGINNIYTEIVATGTTGSNGEYIFSNLEAGNYTMEIVDEKGTYVATYINIKVLGDESIKEQNGAVVLPLAEGQIRVVLSWGKCISDLDAHMISDSILNPFHICFESKKDYYSGRLACEITSDERAYHKAETISLYQALPGNYTYYVHNYRNNNVLSVTDAKVQVYLGGEETMAYTFYVPSSEGRYWDVFTYNAATKVIVPINRMR